MNSYESSNSLRICHDVMTHDPCCRGLQQSSTTSRINWLCEGYPSTGFEWIHWLLLGAVFALPWTNWLETMDENSENIMLNMMKLADFVVILHLPVWGGLLEDLGGDPRTSTWDHPDIMISYDIMNYSNLVSVWWFFRILNIVLDFWSSWFQNHEDKLATPQIKISLPWQQATSLASPCHEGHIKWLVNNSEWITAEVSWATRFTRSLQDSQDRTLNCWNFGPGMGLSNFFGPYMALSWLDTLSPMAVTRLPWLWGRRQGATRLEIRWMEEILHHLGW